jgi:YbbR domain-containing protein
MASFSLVAGFGVWFAIQDVENPRVERDLPFPPGQGVPIEGRDVPNGYLFGGGTVTAVRVEVREEAVEDLGPEDFRAWVDLRDVDPENSTDVEVHVESLRDDVDALEAVPGTITIQLELAVTDPDQQVQVNYSGSLPDGYELLANETEVEPGFVSITGTAEQLESVASVEIDVSLDGRRDESSTFEGDLVARSSSGDAVTVQIEPARAKVTMTIRQTFSQRQLPIVAPITGHPAAGYRIVQIVYEPPTALVSGVKGVMDGLSEIVVDEIDIGGATTNVTQTRQIRIPNASVQPTTVVVRVEIRRDECEISASDRGCPTATFIVAVSLGPPAPGLRVAEATPYWTEIEVSGPLSRLQELSSADFVASASLAAGAPGTASYSVAVDGPEGVRVDSVDPITVTLIPGP